MSAGYEISLDIALLLIVSLRGDSRDKFIQPQDAIVSIQMVRVGDRYHEWDSKVTQPSRPESIHPP